MAETLRIDFVSDVACPWCVIGLRSLLQALDAVGGDVQADIHFQPFELNPNMPPEGENTAEHVAKKYGSNGERSDAARQMLRDHGAALGFSFNYGPESRIWNTFDAHRLLAWALTQGKQLELKEALFKSNFTDQRPTSDHGALIDAAREAGLDPEKARDVLSSDAFAAEVRAEEDHWRQNGIHAVPSVILNSRWLIQGGQPPQVFALLKTSWQGGAPTFIVTRHLMRDLQVPSIGTGMLAWHLTATLWEACIWLHLPEQEQLSIIASRSYLGHGRYGYSATAHALYGRPLSALSQEEAATLVVLSRYPMADEAPERLARWRARLISRRQAMRRSVNAFHQRGCRA